MPSSDPRAAHVVSRGALRLALFPSFFWRSDAGGAPHGVGVTIARALAGSIGVTLDCTVNGSPPKVVEALAAGCADVALLGIDRARAAEVDFSPPLMSADFTYLVPEPRRCTPSPTPTGRASASRWFATTPWTARCS